jgi:hypothetical protein
MRPKTRTVLAGAAIAVLALISAACGGEEKAPADVFQAALVPSADFVARVDLEAIRATPACQDFAKDDVEKTKAEPAMPDSEAVKGTADQLKEIQKITGLTADDVAAILVSADLEAMDLGGEGVERDISKASGVMAVQLKKPLPNAKLVEAAKAAAAKSQGTKAEDIQVAGQAAVRLVAAKEGDTDLYLASAPGDLVVFAAPNTASLEGALQRAQSGQLVALPAELETVRGTLPTGAQFKLAFLAPPKLRQGIQDQLAKAKEDPEAMMWAGMVEPFKDLRSLAIGVECGAELKIGIGGDLGSPEGASQVAMMLQTMVLPMAKGAMAKALGKQPQEIEDRLEVKAEGQALKIGVRLTQEDVAAMKKASEEKKAETAAGE